MLYIVQKHFTFKSQKINNDNKAELRQNILQQ